ncbi:uncharacterized protein isoform X2 [Rhodnius prolixus]|uniref:uncharacterized protein isoform X2 n=1 Tax=Rhodnius prolixus TaxID=13249 RepID=UPI003D1882D3
MFLFHGLRCEICERVFCCSQHLASHRVTHKIQIQLPKSHQPIVAVQSKVNVRKRKSVRTDVSFRKIEQTEISEPTQRKFLTPVVRSRSVRTTTICDRKSKRPTELIQLQNEDCLISSTPVNSSDSSLYLTPHSSQSTNNIKCKQSATLSNTLTKISYRKILLLKNIEDKSVASSLYYTLPENSNHNQFSEDISQAINSDREGSNMLEVQYYSFWPGQFNAAILLKVLATNCAQKSPPIT